MSEPTVKKETGICHFFAAAGYSWGGFRRLLKEAAFRQELLFFAAAEMTLISFGATPSKLLVSVMLFLGVFTCEALNTAIEEVVDRISPEISDVGENAKDLGSFAVFCMLVACSMHLSFVVLAHVYSY